MASDNRKAGIGIEDMPVLNPTNIPDETFLEWIMDIREEEQNNLRQKGILRAQQRELRQQESELRQKFSKQRYWVINYVTYACDNSKEIGPVIHKELMEENEKKQKMLNNEFTDQETRKFETAKNDFQSFVIQEEKATRALFETLAKWTWKRTIYAQKKKDTRIRRQSLLQQTSLLQSASTHRKVHQQNMNAITESAETAETEGGDADNAEGEGKSEGKGESEEKGQQDAEKDKDADADKDKDKDKDNDNDKGSNSKAVVKFAEPAPSPEPEQPDSDPSSDELSSDDEDDLADADDGSIQNIFGASLPFVKARDIIEFIQVYQVYLKHDTERNKIIADIEQRTIDRNAVYRREGAMMRAKLDADFFKGKTKKQIDIEMDEYVNSLKWVRLGLSLELWLFLCSVVVISHIE